MKRFALVLVATTLAAGACSVADRYAPKFAAQTLIARGKEVDAFALGERNTLYYGERATGDVYRVNIAKPSTPVRVTHVDVKTDGQRGLLGLAYRDKALFIASTRASDGKLEVRRWASDDASQVVWVGPESKDLANGGSLRFDNKGGLIISVGELAGGGSGKLLRLHAGGPETQTPTEITRGWHNPFGFTVDFRNNLWVADNAPGREKELVSRGNERDRANRRRHATALPSHFAPSGLAIDEYELYACSYTTKAVFRLHIGLDNVARRRGEVKGLTCQSAIVAQPDGSLITATSTAIYRYPAR